LAIISREYYEALRRQYFSPLNGVRNLAADFMQEWGHDPAEHGELLDCMAEEITEAMIEASAETMRQHGLKDLRVEPEGTKG
jgi:hypothetical protein